MKSKGINIVAFDIPYPPNYGGVIDIYHKVKSLHELGYKVILHVYLYGGKQPAPALDRICHKVYYYQRRRLINPFSGDLPYIVSTRNDEQMLANLRHNQYPILFEGLHTTYYLSHPALKNRFKIVRTHNVEHDYYRALEDAESSFFKKYFFRIEADRLANYEKILKHADLIAAISPADELYYKKNFSTARYVPAFHSNGGFQNKTGRGKFLLYHGNLSVGENNKAALYLVHEVFSKIDRPVVIAGNNPSKQLQTAVRDNPHITLVHKISSSDILKLVQEAQMNVMVTFQSTGVKLKMLNALHRGRHCLVNTAMVQDTGLEELCSVADTPEALVERIHELWEIPFSKREIELRQEILLKDFDNKANAEKLMQFADAGNSEQKSVNSEQKTVNSGARISVKD